MRLDNPGYTQPVDTATLTGEVMNIDNATECVVTGCYEIDDGNFSRVLFAPATCVLGNKVCSMTHQALKL